MPNEAVIKGRCKKCKTMSEIVDGVMTTSEAQKLRFYKGKCATCGEEIIRNFPYQ